MTTPSRDALRRKRHERLRLRISGSAERPRLSVFRSAKYIYAQVIDDTSGRTLAAASSRESGIDGATKVDVGALVGSCARRAGEGRRREARWSSIGAATSTTGGSARSQRAPARAASTCRARGEPAWHASIRPSSTWTRRSSRSTASPRSSRAGAASASARSSSSATATATSAPGIGKAGEVPEAIRKGVEDAKKHLIKVPLVGSTIPHEVHRHFGAAKVMLKPASAGTGVIAGGSVRSVVEAAGIRDLLSKAQGSTNPINVVRATMEASRPSARPTTSPGSAARPPSSSSASAARSCRGRRTRSPSARADERRWWPWPLRPPRSPGSRSPGSARRSATRPPRAARSAPSACIGSTRASRSPTPPRCEGCCAASPS